MKRRLCFLAPQFKLLGAQVLLSFIMLCFPDNPGMVGQVSITIHVLDVNDNIPVIAGGNSAIVCESSSSGQVGRCQGSDWTLKTRMEWMKIYLK